MNKSQILREVIIDVIQRMNESELLALIDYLK